jgi:hypothetical protein
VAGLFLVGDSFRPPRSRQLQPVQHHRDECDHRDCDAYEGDEERIGAAGVSGWLFATSHHPPDVRMPVELKGSG